MHSTQHSAHGTHRGMAMQQRQLLLLYVVVFLYSTCFMAQAPLLPYLVKQLGADASYYGLLQSSFSALQLAGGLLSGPLVDRYGGHALLLLSLGFSVLCYVLTATATSIHMLLVSRLATLMQHAVLAARTLIAHSCPEADRAALLGRIGASYGLGFALGPAVGGLLSSISLTATAWAAAAGSLLAMVVVVLGLPQDASQPAKKDDGSEAAAAAAAPQRLSLSSLAAVTRYPGVPSLLLMQGGANLAGSLMHSTFSLVLQQRFQLSSRENGLVLSWVGVCIAVAQAFVIKPASSYLGEDAAVKISSGLLALTFVAMGAATQLWQLLVCLMPLAAGSVMITTLNTARLSKSVPNNVAGTVMALDMSLSSGLRTVSPLIGTALVQRHGFQGVCVTAAAVLLTTFSAANHLQAPKSKAAGAAHDGGGSGGEDVASVRAQGSTARSPDEKKTD